jgi:hypothetical protein
MLGDPVTVRGHFSTIARFPLECWLVTQGPGTVLNGQASDPLQDTNATVSIRWRIARGGAILTSGDSESARAGYYSDRWSSGRILGTFKPPAKGTYEFLATVDSSHPALAAVPAILEIRPGLSALKSAGGRTLVGKWLGTVSVLIGGLLIVLSWRERRKIRRDLESNS